MPKEDKPKPHPIPQPSEPIAQKDKDKKAKEKEKIKNARHLEDVEVSAVGSITAGTWVAESETDNVRKSKLRE